VQGGEGAMDVAQLLGYSREGKETKIWSTILSIPERKEKKYTKNAGAQSAPLVDYFVEREGAEKKKEKKESKACERYHVWR